MIDRWYPQEWRDRYGAELATYLEDEYGRGRVPLATRLSLMAGGLHQRARYGGLVGDRAPGPDRRRAGTLLVLCAWAALVVAGSSFAKLSEHFDESLPHDAGSHRVPDDAYTIIQTLAGLTGLVVAAGLALAVPALFRFVRSGGWPVLRLPVLRAIVATVLTAVTTGPLIFWARHLTTYDRNGGLASYGALFVVCAVLFVVDLALWTSVAVAAARRVTFTPRVLRAESVLALVVSAAIVAIAGAMATWTVVLAGRAPAFVTAGGSIVLNLRLDLTALVTVLATAAAVTGSLRIVRTRSV